MVLKGKINKISATQRAISTWQSENLPQAHTHGTRDTFLLLRQKLPCECAFCAFARWTFGAIFEIIQHEKQDGILPWPMLDDRSRLQGLPPLGLWIQICVHWLHSPADHKARGIFLPSVWCRENCMQWFSVTLRTFISEGENCDIVFSNAVSNINQSNFYRANIPGEARLSGATITTVY